MLYKQEQIAGKTHPPRHTFVSARLFQCCSLCFPATGTGRGPCDWSRHQVQSHTEQVRQRVPKILTKLDLLAAITFLRENFLTVTIYHIYIIPKDY